MDEKSSFKRGRLRDIIDYFYAYPNRDIPIAELETHFKGKYNRGAILASLSHVTSETGRRTNGTPIKTTDRRWVWRLDVDGNTGEAKQLERGDITLEILKERDTYILCEDVTDGKIYKLILVG